jgi:hypothetical protein
MAKRKIEISYMSAAAQNVYLHAFSARNWRSEVGSRRKRVFNEAFSVSAGWKASERASGKFTIILLAFKVLAKTFSTPRRGWRGKQINSERFDNTKAVEANENLSRLRRRRSHIA